MLCDFHTHRPAPGVRALVSATAPPVRGDWSFQALPGAFPTGVPDTFSVPASCVAIGEVGLDRRLSTPLEKQVGILKTLLDKSGELPVVVHCVRAYPELNAVLKKVRRRVLLHRFSGSEEELERQLRHERLISLSVKELKRKMGKSAFGSRPENLRFLALETDDDASVTIGEVYRLAGELFQVEAKQLEAILMDNYRRFTGERDG